MNSPEICPPKALRCSRLVGVEPARVFPLLITLISMFGVTHGNAQILYGSIVGTVRDALGLAIVDAKVKATQLKTDGTIT